MSRLYLTSLDMTIEKLDKTNIISLFRRILREKRRGKEEEMDIEKKKMPESVKVGYLDCPIVLVPKDLWAHESRVGEFNHWTGVIRLNGGMSDGLLASTLLHEIFHAVQDVFDSPESLNVEGVCNLAANGLMTVWRDNPALMAWIGSVITKEE